MVLAESFQDFTFASLTFLSIAIQQDIVQSKLSYVEYVAMKDSMLCQVVEGLAETSMPRLQTLRLSDTQLDSGIAYQSPGQVVKSCRSTFGTA
jgi:hypothetical protein